MPLGVRVPLFSLVGSGLAINHATRSEYSLFNFSKSPKVDLLILLKAIEIHISIAIAVLASPKARDKLESTLLRSVYVILNASVSLFNLTFGFLSQLFVGRGDDSLIGSRCKPL